MTEILVALFFVFLGSIFLTIFAMWPLSTMFSDDTVGGVGCFIFIVIFAAMVYFVFFTGGGI